LTPDTLPAVACGLIFRPDVPEVLLELRPKDKPLGGLWSFPGGKAEPGETPKDALVRELREGLGIEVLQCEFLVMVMWAYPHRDYARHPVTFFVVTDFTGTPEPLAADRLLWTHPNLIPCYPMVESNGVALVALRNWLAARDAQKWGITRKGS